MLYLCLGAFERVWRVNSTPEFVCVCRMCCTLNVGAFTALLLTLLIRLVLLRRLSVSVLSLLSISVCVAMATFNI
jgi:hypothetical protein